MTTKCGIWFLITAFALCGGGCASIDTTPPGNPDRVLQGALAFDGILPAGAEVVVRLIETSQGGAGTVARNDLPVATAARPERSERVLGEYRAVLPAAIQRSLPFKIDYFAEDTVLRRGLTVDARISIGGRVRMRTIQAHVVTLASSPFNQEVAVQSVQ